MEIERNFMEKRKFGRLASRMSVAYRKVGSAPQLPVGSLSYDVGGGGVRLLSHEFIPRTTKLVVELPLEYPMKTINALARVVWVEKKPYAERYDLVLEFLDINSTDQRDLVNYVERNLVHANMV